MFGVFVEILCRVYWGGGQGDIGTWLVWLFEWYGVVLVVVSIFLCSREKTSLVFDFVREGWGRFCHTSMFDTFT